ncbi:uncharacterized protein N7515_002791 [Penicillium bovifimosum]|uniref:Uncharacterized protein n=1 Tax=Penicillium bovifimosum TaxID=126998 RepID=A0A9W9HCL5_9EURO|nr:uncharacterized protein N7515_002791 [Penicillium bovifimosum]KAJ5144004.1 hypothetical protein N7515_002791 [Penicillium bovifimosum]
MWREPSKTEDSRSALEKDSSAAARSSIRRGPTLRHTGSRARRSNIMSSFQSQIIDELRRAGEPRRVSRISLIPPNGSSDGGVNGMTYEQAEREAASRATSRGNERTPRQSDAQRRASRHQALTDLLARVDGHSRSVASYTPNFAPALGYHSSASSTRPDASVQLPPMRDWEDRNERELPANAFFPPEIRGTEIRARRSSHAQSRPARDPITDGLGDRQRSPSPDGDRNLGDWQTLLLTMIPDATPPSTDTSFASNSAPAADDPRNDVPHDFLSGPMIEAAANRAEFRIQPLLDSLNCDFSSDDEEPPISYNQFLANRRRLHSQRSTISRHPPFPTIATLLDQNQDDELHHMQVILDRLARREDIPDDWWAAAGLSRTLDRGLNSSMDSTDIEGPSRTTRGDN